ncbi:MAG: DUF47 domain-containing protein [Ignavibacteria bacterium]
MFKKFLPKAPMFFDILAELSGNIYEATKLLQEMLVKHDHLGEYSTQIHILENKCDDLTHTVINELNETFVTPIDREDIYALANSLDNIIDSIDTIGTRLNIYKIKTPIHYGQELSEILLSQTKLLSDVVHSLQDRKHTMSKLISIRDLETQGDTVFREAITKLFKNEKDIIELIKKKEILENIEKAVDNCQTATLVMEGIVIKNL